MLEVKRNKHNGNYEIYIDDVFYSSCDNMREVSQELDDIEREERIDAES